MIKKSSFIPILACILMLQTAFIANAQSNLDVPRKSTLTNAAPTNAVISQEDIDAYRLLIAQDVRLASIGYRIAKANAPFCTRKNRNNGLILHDVAQYPDQQLMRAIFPFEQEIEVAGVVKGSAAETAGIRAGDGIISFGESLWKWDEHPAPDASKKGFERLSEFKRMMRGAFDNNAHIDFQLKRKEDVLHYQFEAEEICISEFEVSTSDALNAGASGIRVRVSQGLMSYAPDDDELSVIVAHEMAHNILGHRQYLKENGVSDGIGRFFGKSVKMRRKTEEEADRLAIWLLYNAGYDPQKAIDFWMRFGKKYGQGIFTGPTHARWKTRVKYIQEEIEKIHQMQKNVEGKLYPPILANAQMEGGDNDAQ